MTRGTNISAVAPYGVQVVVTGADVASGNGLLIKAKNRTTGEFTLAETSSNIALFNLSDLSSDGTDGGTKSGGATDEVIEVMAFGDSFGGATHTVQAGLGGAPVDLAVTGTTATNTVGVTI